ncbi:hypothetical protein AB0M28_04310 [Streptomyces sp. NPDC051940]|uniref:hypothetical protein n=1 Tax=Streptomyces sp. NPDC051940 TaxID=3155675 RepID=UPI003431D246
MERTVAMADEAGLPALPELAAALSAAPARPEPPGGGDALRLAAAGWFARRGLHTGPGHARPGRCRA